MIIQCEKCQTRFRLDDSRVTVKGVKVRCTRCKHVFTVRKEDPNEDSLQPEVALAEFSPPFDASALPFDTEEFEIPGAKSGQASPATTTAAGGEFDFSEEEMSGSVVQAAPESAPGDFSFDFGDTGFAETDAVNGLASGSKSDTPLSFDTPADALFNPGEIDFGDELAPAAVPQVSQNGLKPSPEIPSVPLAEATVTREGDKSDDDKLTQSFLGETASNEQQEEELPPLSIPSRRKQSPLFGVLIAVVALLVISVLGYFGYSLLSTPKETAPPESGKIGVRAITSAFVKNSTAGELLVVSGDAFNEYSKPRAALQVMVTVLDPTGQKVATKIAYGGNPLTKEQLETLPLDKIEAAMANPFGDSLANMGVAPGKSIPFVVVLANIPAGAKDFSVKSAGSTVATGGK